MLIVAAPGGKALLRRGEPLMHATQLRNLEAACYALAPLALEHEVGCLLERDYAAGCPDARWRHW